MIPAGLTLVLLGALAALLRRPLLAICLTVLTAVLLRQVNSAKRRALGEPLVFSDLGLFAQALRFPRLYLPYIGWPVPLALALLFVALMVAGITFESSAGSWRWLGVALLGAALLALGSWAAPPLSFEPHRDLARLGLLGLLWRYWLEERKPVPALPSCPFRFRGVDPTDRPPIVVLQSESFVDVRRLGIHARLEEFDRLCAEGLSGRLSVPAWGANTMRTEFAFLSGVPNAALGVHRFNPYRYIARRPVMTLAALLRERGYRTVCMHPYPGAFFARHRVLPNLGFDEFLDLKYFAGAERAGPYVADSALTQRLLSVLSAATRPLFVFAITMESHGPFRLEGDDELAVYLEHLANADAALGPLTRALRARGDGVVCVFGDHVPSLPRLRHEASAQDGRTDYLVWRAGRVRQQRCDLSAEQLGQCVLDAIGA